MQVVSPISFVFLILDKAKLYFRQAFSILNTKKVYSFSCSMLYLVGVISSTFVSNRE